MALRNGQPLTIRPRGASDALDGTNAFPGAMSLLQNLVPAPHTKGIFVPRSASLSAFNFGGAGGNALWDGFLWGSGIWGSFSSPGQISALLTVGNIAYGMIGITSGTFVGKDVPFAVNLAIGAVLPIATPGGAAAMPTTQAATGDWTPPQMAVVGSKIMITHPGYPGGAIKFGWLDLRGFSSATVTGNTHTSTTLDNLSTNVLQAGWQVGDTISSSAGDTPANTTIVSIASNGLSLVLSHAATGSNAGVTLTVGGGTMAMPLYGSGDTNINNLIAVPTSVAQFNGRAYFATNVDATVGVQFTDSGIPNQITNATQALTFNNGIPVTALAGLPLSATTLGGVIQSIIAFQGDQQMQQITGDPTTNNLSVNSLGIGVGTLAPNTICPTPDGLAFIAPDGMRIIDFLARVGNPIGAYGTGVCVPFLNAVFPTRMCAAYNQNVMRVSVQNANVATSGFQEWWFDFELKIWSGPHSFPAALIEAYQSPAGAVQGHGFVLAPIGVPAQLFTSSVTPNPADTYVENGVALSWVAQTVLLPDNQEMSENAVIETAVGLMAPPQFTTGVLALDEAGNNLGAVSIVSQSQGQQPALSTWGSSVWGAFQWNQFSYYVQYYREYPVPWPAPLVFKQMQLRLTGNSVLGVGVGNLYLRYQKLGYLMQASGGRV